jgi:hypothetical protein
MFKQRMILYYRGNIMAWRFRKSFDLFPGVKINLSKSGISTSFGTGPFHINVGPRGAFSTTSLPGTGISFRQKMPLEGQPRDRIANSHGINNPTNAPVIGQGQLSPRFHEIKSADTSEMTSDGMNEFQALVAKSLREHRELNGLLEVSQHEYSVKNKKLERWKGSAFRRLFCKGSISRLDSETKELSEKIAEYQEQKGLAVIQTEIEISDDYRSAYSSVCETFSRLADSNMIWDKVSVIERDEGSKDWSASSIERHKVSFGLRAFTPIACSYETPCLGNYNGGLIYIYPAFVVYYVDDINFCVIRMSDLDVKLIKIQFMEEGRIPDDAKVVGETWRKVNLDGSPDKRYKGNYKIPICQYGGIKITSKGGLSEEYVVSNYDSASEFCNALHVLIRSCPQVE